MVAADLLRFTHRLANVVYAERIYELDHGTVGNRALTPNSWPSAVSGRDYAMQAPVRAR